MDDDRHSDHGGGDDVGCPGLEERRWDAHRFPSVRMSARAGRNSKNGVAWPTGELAVVHPTAPNSYRFSMLELMK